MPYNLFLDDCRDANIFLQDIRTWETVRNYNDFCRIIERKGVPDFISFDHDLSFEDQNKTEGFVEKTGYDCAKFLIEYCMRTEQLLPEWQCHSMSSVGRVRINELLRNYRDKTQILEG